MIKTKETDKLKTFASFACIGSWVLYFISVISAVIFLRKSGVDWASATLIPLAGVLVALSSSKLFLFNLFESKNLKTREIVYPLFKYTFLGVGLGSTLACLYYYSKNDYMNMARLISFGDPLIAAFLSSVGYEIKNKLFLNKKL